MPERTVIDVRVIAVGGKFLSDDIGGAAITVRDADTQEILARGVTKGDSGPNGKGGVMCKSVRRGEPLPMDDKTSRFRVELNLECPKRVEVTAFGPLGARASANTISVITWVYSGKDMTEGNGLLFEMPGLICQVVNPPTHTTFSDPADVSIVANIAMICGCPISRKKKDAVCPGEPEDQPWLPDEFEVCAIIKAASERGSKHVKLCWDDKITPPVAGRFIGSLASVGPGTYEMTIFAYQKKTGNTGVDVSTFVVSAPTPPPT